MTELETDRLLIREVRALDGDAFCRYMQPEHLLASLSDFRAHMKMPFCGTTMFLPPRRQTSRTCLIARRRASYRISTRRRTGKKEAT